MNQRLGDLIKACWRFDLYPAVAARPLREAIAALALLSLLYATSNGIYGKIILLPKLEQIVAQMPAMDFHRGVVTFSPDFKSSVWLDPKRHWRVGFLTDNDLNRKETDPGCNWVGEINKTHFTIRDPRGLSWSFRIPESWEFQLRPDSGSAFLKSWWPALVAGWGAFSFIWFFLSRLLLAATLMFLPFPRQKTFTHAFILALFALAPATIFGLVLQWLNAFFVVSPVWIALAFVPYLLIVILFYTGGLLDLRRKDAILVQ